MAKRSNTDGIEYTDTPMVLVGATSGAPYGCMNGLEENITCTLADDWYQVTFDEAAVSHLTTINLGNNDMAVTYAGVYRVSVTACFHSNASHDFELMVKKNDEGGDVGPHLFQTTAVADKVENTAGDCLVTLAAGDRLELWVMCTSAAGRVAEFDHVSLVCEQRGGV